MPVHNVVLNRARLTTFWAFPIQPYVVSGLPLFEAMTSTPAWLADDAPRFHQLCSASHDFDGCRLASSTYSQTTERVGATTLAGYAAKGLMPLELHFRDVTTYDESLHWRPAALHLSGNGAMTLRHEVEFDSPADGSLDAAGAIREYHTLIRELRNDVGIRASKFAQLWSELHPDIPLSFPHDGGLGEESLLYESIDMDFDICDEVGAHLRQPIKTVIHKDHVDVVRQLAAISRMSSIEPQHYDAGRLARFREADIGNREDELWLVNPNRMMRSHPDWGNPTNRSFYEDSLLLCEILLQQKASLQYVDQWLRESKGMLRKHSYTLDSESGARGISDVVLGVERVTDQLADPTQLLLGIRNPFFRDLAQTLAAEMQVIGASERAFQSVSLFLGVTRSLHSHSSAVSQARSASDQQRVAEETQQVAEDTRRIEDELREMTATALRLTRLSVAIAMIAALSALAAAVVAVITLGRTP